MIGRVARDNPMLLRGIDSLYNEERTNKITRKEIIEAYIPYVELCQRKEENAYYAIRHMEGLFSGKRGSKQWKQILNTPASHNIKASELLHIALKELPKEVLNEE